MLLDTDSYAFTLSDVSYQTTCAAPGYIAPEVLKLMETTGVSDFESLAAAANAPVFTPQTDDFGLAVHIFKMLNRGIHPYSSSLAKRKSALRHAYGRACSACIYPRRLNARAVIYITLRRMNVPTVEESAPC